MNLNINFIKSTEFSFTYQCLGKECVFNVMTTNSAEFKKSESVTSFINYMKTIRFDKVRVSWIGTIPDIELSDFVETLNIASNLPTPVPDDNPRYPTVFNPFEIIPTQSRSVSNHPHDSIKIDLETIKTHIENYPAHPNLLDISAKNISKVQNYIKHTLGKNMANDYLEQLTNEIMNYAKLHPNRI